MFSQNNNNNNNITTPTSLNPYITRKLNNMDKAKMMKAERCYRTLWTLTIFIFFLLYFFFFFFFFVKSNKEAHDNEVT